MKGVPTIQESGGTNRPEQTPTAKMHFVSGESHANRIYKTKHIKCPKKRIKVHLCRVLPLCCCDPSSLLGIRTRPLGSSTGMHPRPEERGGNSGRKRSASGSLWKQNLLLRQKWKLVVKAAAIQGVLCFRKHQSDSVCKSHVSRKRRNTLKFQL